MFASMNSTKNAKGVFERNKTRLGLVTLVIGAVGVSAFVIAWVFGAFSSDSVPASNSQKVDSREVSDLLALKLTNSVDLSKLTTDEADLLESFDPSAIKKGIQEEEVKMRLLETQKALKNRKFLSIKLEGEGLNNENCEKLRTLVDDESWEKYNFGEEEDALVTANIESCEFLLKKTKFEPLVKFINAPDEKLEISKADPNVKQLVRAFAKMSEEEQKLIVGEESFENFKEFVNKPVNKLVITEAAQEAPTVEDKIFVRPIPKALKKNVPSAKKGNKVSSEGEKRDLTSAGKEEDVPSSGSTSKKPSKIEPKLKPVKKVADNEWIKKKPHAETTGDNTEDTEEKAKKNEGAENTEPKNPSSHESSDNSRAPKPNPQSGPTPNNLGVGLIPLSPATKVAGKMPSSKPILKNPAPSIDQKRPVEPNLIIQYMENKIPKTKLDEFDSKSVNTELTNFISQRINSQMAYPHFAFFYSIGYTLKYVEAMRHPPQGINVAPIESVKQIAFNALPQDLKIVINGKDSYKSYHNFYSALKKRDSATVANFFNYMFSLAILKQLQSIDGKFEKTSPQAIALACYAHYSLRFGIKQKGSILRGVYSNLEKITEKFVGSFDCVEWDVSEMQKFVAALTTIRDNVAKQPVTQANAKVARRAFIIEVYYFLCALSYLYGGLGYTQRLQTINDAFKISVDIQNLPSF